MMDSGNGLTVNETWQDYRKNIFLISGIIVGAVALVLGVNSVARNFFGIAFLLLWSLFLLREIVGAYLRFFTIPQKMIFHDNGIVIQRYLRNDITLDINEIERIEYSRLVSLFISRSGYFEYSGRSTKIYVSKSILRNLEDFVLGLQKVKPHLSIDGRLM